MSLTTHAPGEPCVGHCAACGAFSEWSEIIAGLLAALEDVDDYLDESDPTYYPVPEVVRGIVYAAAEKAEEGMAWVPTKP